MSFDGQVDFGLVGDYDAMADLDSFGLDLEGAIPEIVATVRQCAIRWQRDARGAERRGARQVVRVALAQIDPTVGDVEGNTAKVAEWIHRPRPRAQSWRSSPSSASPAIRPRTST